MDVHMQLLLMVSVTAATAVGVPVMMGAAAAEIWGSGSVSTMMLPAWAVHATSMASWLRLSKAMSVMVRMTRLSMWMG